MKTRGQLYREITKVFEKEDSFNYRFSEEDTTPVLDKANQDLIQHLLKRNAKMSFKDFAIWEAELESKIFYWFGSLKKPLSINEEEAKKKQ